MVHFQMNNQLMKSKIDSSVDMNVANYLEARDGPIQSPTTVLKRPSFIPFLAGKFCGQLKKETLFHTRIFLSSKTYKAP